MSNRNFKKSILLSLTLISLQNIILAEDINSTTEELFKFNVHYRLPDPKPGAIATSGLKFSYSYMGGFRYTTRYKGRTYEAKNNIYAGSLNLGILGLEINLDPRKTAMFELGINIADSSSSVSSTGQIYQQKSFDILYPYLSVGINGLFNKKHGLISRIFLLFDEMSIKFSLAGGYSYQIDDKVRLSTGIKYNWGSEEGENYSLPSVNLFWQLDVKYFLKNKNSISLLK